MDDERRFRVDAAKRVVQEPTRCGHLRDNNDGRKPDVQRSFTEHAKFDWSLDVEKPYGFGFQPCKQAVALFGRDGHLNGNRLIAQFKKMGRMQSTIVSDTFRSWNQGGTTQAKFAGQF